MPMTYKNIYDPDTGELVNREREYPATFTDEADLWAFMQPYLDLKDHAIEKERSGGNKKAIVGAAVAFFLGTVFGLHFLSNVL